MTALAYRRHVLVMWFVIAVLLFAVAGSRAYTGASWDTDDFMRLVQVRDLLAGQAFTDLTQHRLNPPEGTPMHWSRLPDLPLALAARVLSPWLAGDDALAAAAMIVPPLYLLAFLWCYALAARLVLGAARAPVALIVAMTGSGALAQFAPGRADYHGLQLVLMTGATTLLLMGVARRRWRNRIAWAGVPFALSVWIGVETLPVIAAWFAALGVAWCRDGRTLALAGAREYDGARGYHRLAGDAVYTADPERGFDMARRVRSGSLTVNGMIVDPKQPFGGFKQSGVGREGGVEGLDNYVETKTVHFA